MDTNQDKVKIINAAFQKVGAQPISTVDDDTPEANLVRDQYDQWLDDLLIEEDWDFARKTIALQALDTTQGTGLVVEFGDGLSYAYSYPDDYVRWTDKYPEEAVISCEGERILSDTESLKIKYTFRQQDITKYPPDFIQALILKIGMEICENITKNLNKKLELLQEYESKLSAAALKNKGTSTQKEPKADSWENSRISDYGQ